jgi:two-component sensor histidine kinase
LAVGVRAQKHPEEAARLAALARYDVLDTPSEAEFDDVVTVLAAFCEVPVSVITLVESERQWFKAKVGLDISETPIAQSICAHGILEKGIFEISDTTKDRRTADNPFVAHDPNLRFYAGAPLETPEGLPLGMLCVLDTKPRVLNDAQKELLRVMSRQVMNQLELRHTLKLERTARSEAEDLLADSKKLLAQNEMLRREVDHRVKNSLQQVASFLALQQRRAQGPAADLLAAARGRVDAVVKVHDHLHRHAEHALIRVDEFLKTLCASIAENSPANVRIETETDAVELQSERVMTLGLAANELISNAMKHAYRGREGTIHISLKQEGDDAVLTVRDNGAGLPADFGTGTSQGLGLRVLGMLATQLRGALAHVSDNKGTSFTLRFPLGEPA